MDHNVIQMEHAMWEAVLHRDADAFKKLVSADAVMVCGGCRCLGREYADLLADFRIDGYSITHMEVIDASDRQVTLHYVIRTRSEDAGAQDLAGLFHVVSLWKRKNETWKLIFNMDSRIMER